MKSNAVVERAGEHRAEGRHDPIGPEATGRERGVEAQGEGGQRRAFGVELMHHAHVDAGERQRAHAVQVAQGDRQPDVELGAGEEPRHDAGFQPPEVESAT